MKNIIEIEKYQNILKTIADIDFPWHQFSDKAILITGGCGLIGSFLVDLFCYRNKFFQQNIRIVVLARDEKAILERFNLYVNESYFKYLIQDICNPIHSNEQYDYVIHAASGANPTAYSTIPVDVMKSNFIGMLNILDYTVKHPCKRVYFVSSGEVYGDSNDPNKVFLEDDLNTVDINQYRSCYPVSKMATETLVHSFIKQYNIDVVIGRFSHIYGPTYTKKDNRVISQFLNNILDGKNIILKSQGLQKRSYCFVADAASAVLYQIFYGLTGEVYNVSNDSCFVRIRDLANLLANENNLKVEYEIASVEENSGYTTIAQTVMSSEKLKQLGWSSFYSLDSGLKDTIDILKEFNHE